MDDPFWILMRAMVGLASGPLVGSKYSQESTGAKLAIDLGFFWPARRKDCPFTKSTGASGFILVFNSRAFAEFSVQIGVEQVNQLAMELQLASKLVASLPLSVQLLFHFEFMFQFLALGFGFFSFCFLFSNLLFCLLDLFAFMAALLVFRGSRRGGSWELHKRRDIHIVLHIQITSLNYFGFF